MADEDDWSGLMRAAATGDTEAYRRLLAALAPFLRRVVRAGLARSRCDPSESEDIVQETLLAIHLKRHTWDADRPLLPWVRAIAQNKLVDALRRRRSQLQVSIEDILDELPGDIAEPGISKGDVDRLIGQLDGRQRAVVSAMTEGESAKETAARLGMTEVAVRVTLHRALKSLAAKLKDSDA